MKRAVAALFLFALSASAQTSDEITFRRGMKYPPAVALINAVIKARTREAAMADAGDVVAALRIAGAPYRVLGPAPAPLSQHRRAADWPCREPS